MNLLQPYTAPRQGDPYWDNVVLHLKAKGANASTVFGDAKGHPVSNTATTTVSTTQSKFGGVSMNVPSATDGAYVAGSDDFVFTGDYTIELWVYLDLAVVRTLIGNYSSNVSGHWQVQGGANQTLTLAVGGVGAMSCGTITGSAWVHVAVVRSSGYTSVYKDGVLANGAASYSGTIGLNTQRLYFGNNAGGSQGGIGYLDDIRITKGVARYTASFTPPAAPNPVGILRSPLDVLLMPFNGANGSTAFHDQTGKAVTAYGNAQIGNRTDLYGGSAGYFDGTGDYLSVAASNDFNFGSGDFTIECWIWCSSGAGYPVILGNNANYASTAGAFILQLYPSGAALFGWYSSQDISSTQLVCDSAWHHLAVTRQGTALKLFVDGALGNSATTSTAIGLDANTLFVGAYNGPSYYANGYIDDIRIIKGMARYTGEFDRPAFPAERFYDPYTDWWTMFHDQYSGNVVLHCPFNETTYDTKHNAITSVGNAAVTATQSKFGGTALALDGVGDYIYSTNSIAGLAFGTGDFTIEGWFRTAAGTGDLGLFQMSDSAGGLSTTYTYSLHAYYNGSAVAFNLNNSGVLYSPAITLNTWQHVAIVRVSGVVTVYLDGVGGTPGTKNGSVAATYIAIGCMYSSAYPMSGYIDDFRISNRARYTANFTPEPRQSPEY